MKQTEKDLQKSILEYLEKVHFGIWEHTLHPKNETASGKWDKRFMGNSKGVPDLIIFKPNAKYHGLALELKAKGGVLSASQQDWIARLNLMHYYARTIYSLEEFIEVLNKYIKDAI